MEVKVMYDAVCACIHMYGVGRVCWDVERREGVKSNITGVGHANLS